MDQQIFWNDLNQVDTENLSSAEGSVDASMWSSGGPSFTRHQLNPSVREEPKVEIGWASSLTISVGQESGPDDCRLEINNTNVNGNQADNSLLLAQNPVGDDFVNNSEYIAGSESFQLSSSGGLNLHGSSSSGTGFLSENCQGQPGSLMDYSRRACKRKSIEGVPAHISVSARHDASTALSINPFSVSASPESSERNCRARTDAPPHQPSSLLPLAQAFDPVPNSQPLSWTGASSSRISRTSANVVQRISRARAMTFQRLISLREESASRSAPRNNVAENLVFASVQDPTSWDFDNGSIGIRHTDSRVRQFYPRGSGRGIDLSPHPANHDTSREMTHRSSVAIHGHQQHYVRSASLTDTHSDEVVSMPPRSLVAARVERSRALSQQIHNAMELVRRAENAHLEDILLFDHSVFLERALNRRDRHRELRLDVDNMSYEELLELEERIGNVSTGLDEETVLKYLKQRKYISLSEETPNDAEPCCICQEEYNEGEEVGRLDCGHDFHTMCIKQWLTVKNSCPICKTDGLDTEKRKMKVEP